MSQKDLKYSPIIEISTDNLQSMNEVKIATTNN